MKIEVFSSLVMMSVYWLWLCNHVLLVSSHCLDDQKSLLIQLKNNLTFADNTDKISSRLNSWNASHDCCKWMGVTCDDEGHVTDLDLSGGGFVGTIPNSLSNLTELRYLDLSSNNFIGPMTSFGMAKKLTFLYLFNNSLSGTIPSSSLFTLPQLKELDLSYNQFSQLDEFINVTSSRLKFLDLSFNNLSGPFPTSFFQLSTLSDLSLSSNNFNESTQLNKLWELRGLTSLSLSYNNLAVHVNFTNVEPSSFPNIVELYLVSCNLKTFPSFLRNLSGISTLDLSENRIQGIVPKWIWNVRYLNISHNLLTELEGPLQNITFHLNILDLHHNKLQGPIPVFNGDAWYLDYSSNNFSFIPRDIGNYLSVTFLYLSNNNVHGSIPISLCNSSLALLDLSFNKISGTIPSCLMSLIVLDLKMNNLSGSIPDAFSTYCRLEILSLYRNQIDGRIPKSLAHCSDLAVLDLGSNQIIDGFPCFLKEISKLRILVLGNNKFQGSLGCLKGNTTWEMLQIVDIAFNNFSGHLPGKIFSTWKRFKMHNEVDEQTYKPHIRSDYQNNVTIIIKGQQMELVKILTTYTSIDLSSNHFEGPIPEELMEFKELHFLNLSNNALSGEIPSSIGNMKELESLDFSQNSLSGEIPAQLASLTFLGYLNLSFNHLVGKIPTGTQLQSFTASSFEGNNGLSGPPLPSIENRSCTNSSMAPQQKCGRLACTVDWNFISVEVGLVFGHGIVVGPLLIWKGWRIWYWKLIHKILCWIFPQMYLEYVTQRGQTYATLRWGH